MLTPFIAFKNLKSKINYQALQFKLLKDPIFENSQFEIASSISDGSSYHKICIAAVEDENIYKNFRRYKSYFYVLEHVSKELGQTYLNLLLKTNSTLNSFHNSKSQNKIGNPLCYRYKKIGSTSPTLLRYLKVLDDLNDFFGSLNGRHIVEIGVGYGGQAGVIIQNSAISKYTLFDLNEVNDLAIKFLKDLGLSNKINAFDGRKPTEINCDLVISNYAFSELNKEVQDIYLKNVISRSKSGYITWNNLGYKLLGAYSLNEIVEKIPNARVIDEFPLTAKENKIIIWGSK